MANHVFASVQEAVDFVLSNEFEEAEIEVFVHSPRLVLEREFRRLGASEDGYKTDT
jgi:hypothetical protein